MQGTNRLPSYAYLSPEGVQGYARLTEEGAYSLLPAEIEWRDRYIALESRGYLLRRRYHPDWSPSWTGTNLDPTYCEDSVIIHVSQLSCLQAYTDGLCLSFHTLLMPLVFETTSVSPSKSQKRTTSRSLYPIFCHLYKNPITTAYHYWRSSRTPSIRSR